MTTIYDLPKPSPAALMRSKALTEHIRQEMNGSLSFSRFMELALTHPDYGYYNAENFALGKEGDFTTAPEISPLFAQCLARQVQQVFDHLETREILELGAGSGRMAQDLLTELNRLGCAVLRYYIYEISPVLRGKQQSFLQAECPEFFSRVIWLDHLPTDFIGMIIANEVLDALPVHCFRMEEDGVKERCVSWEQDKFVWQLSTPTTAELAQKVEILRDLYGLTGGYESEINLQLGPFIHAITHSLKKGVILFADYGYGQAEYYHPERQGGTLTCFYQHRRHHDPLILPGLQDMTAHVDFTAVIENAAENGCSLAGYTTQTAFLLAAGIMELAAKAECQLSQIEAFHLHQGIKLLTLPTEMGERIKWMALSKEMEFSLLGFELQDRRRDL